MRRHRALAGRGPAGARARRAAAADAPRRTVVCGSPWAGSSSFSEPLGDHLHLYSRTLAARAARGLRLRPRADRYRGRAAAAAAAAAGERHPTMRVLIDTTYARRAPQSGTGVYVAQLLAALGELDGVEMVRAFNRRRSPPGGGGRASARNLISRPVVGARGAPAAGAKGSRRPDPPPIASAGAGAGRPAGDHRPRPGAEHGSRPTSIPAGRAVAGRPPGCRAARRRRDLRQPHHRCRRPRAVGGRPRAPGDRAPRPRSDLGLRVERAVGGIQRQRGALPLRRRRGAAQEPAAAGRGLRPLPGAGSRSAATGGGGLGPAPRGWDPAGAGAGPRGAGAASPRSRRAGSAVALRGLRPHRPGSNGRGHARARRPLSGTHRGVR